MIETPGAKIRETFWKSNRPRGGGRKWWETYCFSTIWTTCHKRILLPPSAAPAAVFFPKQLREKEFHVHFMLRLSCSRIVATNFKISTFPPPFHSRRFFMAFHTENDKTENFQLKTNSRYPQKFSSALLLASSSVQQNVQPFQTIYTLDEKGQCDCACTRPDHQQN